MLPHSVIKRSHNRDLRGHTRVGDWTAKELIASLSYDGDDADTRNVLAGIIKHMGGQDEFCKSVANMIKETKNTPTAKAKVLSMIASMLQTKTKLDAAKNLKMDDMDTGEIEAAVRLLMQKGRRKRNAKPSEAAHVGSERTGEASFSPTHSGTGETDQGIADVV